VTTQSNATLNAWLRCRRASIGERHAAEASQKSRILSAARDTVDLSGTVQSADGTVKRQVYVDGFAPTVLTFDEFSANNDLRMARVAECQ